MTAAEYRAYLLAMVVAFRDAGRALERLPLEELATQLEQADSIGPFVDPTAWRRATDSGSLELQKELLAWARRTRDAFPTMVERAIDVAIAEGPFHGQVLRELLEADS